MLSPQKAGLLQAFLGGLPPHLAARLAKAVEVDRLSDGATLPHELILKGLRPVLSRGERRERTPTPLRLFCHPFEDILTSAPRTQKQKGRVSRTSVLPVWEWVSETLIPKAARDYVNDIKAHLVGFRTDEARTRAVAFWSEASLAMREALSTDRGRSRAETALDGSAAAADAAEMALLLGVGPDVLALQDQFPRPVPSLTPDLVGVARATYERFVEASPDAAPYIVVIVMNRLSRRWEALRLTAHLSRKSQDTLIASTDIGLAGDILFGELDGLANVVRNVKQPNFEPTVLIESVANFAELSSAVVKEIEVRRDGRWGQTLLKGRADVGSGMELLMERVPKEIAIALARKPARAIEQEKLDRARRYGMLLAGCRPFAGAASFAAPLKEANDKSVRFLRGYCDEALWDLRAVNGNQRQFLEEQFALAIDLTAMLCGEEEAEILRRRHRANRPAAA